MHFSFTKEHTMRNTTHPRWRRAWFRSLTLESLESRDMPSFLPPVGYWASHPETVEAADLNHDGCQDVVANHQSAYYISVLLGDCTGALGTETKYSSPTASHGFTIADLNNDSHPDIVRGGTPTSVILGNGDGTFQSPIISSAIAWNVAVADFNHDGNLDLGASYNSPYPLRVSLGNGDGTLQTPVAYSGTTSPGDIQTGDFNGDGWSDLVLTHGPANAVSIYLNRRDGSFKPPWTFITCGGPRMLALADFNRDGRLDVSTGCITAKLLGVHLGNGDGTLQALQVFNAGDAPWALAIADYNRDRRLDIAVNSPVTPQVKVLFGLGNGDFQTHVGYPAGGAGYFLKAADLNNDRYPELIQAASFAGTVNVLLNDRGWPAPTPPIYDVGADPSPSASAGHAMLSPSAAFARVPWGPNRHSQQIIVAGQFEIEVPRKGMPPLTPALHFPRNIVFADGSLHFFSQDISLATWQALGSIDAGEVVGSY